MHEIPWTVITGVIMCALSIATFAVGRVSSSNGKAEDKMRMSTQLDRISDTCSDVRDTVREMSRKLDDHSDRITRVEQQVLALSTRVDRVEENCDSRYRAGGTD